MSVQIQRRGDTTAAHAGFIGTNREITIDTDKKTIVVHDGETVGGFPLARENMSNVSAMDIRARGAVLSIDIVGMIIAAPLESFNGFLLCNGAAISRNAYSVLFSKIGTIFGAGNDETTFNIPDYRGYFLRGKGGNSATDFKTAQGDAIRNMTGNLATVGNGGFVATGVFADAGAGGLLSNSGEPDKKVLFDASRVVPTAVENRPINKAVNFFIKY